MANHHFSNDPAGLINPVLNNDHPRSNTMHPIYHLLPDGDDGDRPHRPESLYNQFIDLRDKASMDHSQLIRAIKFFNEHVSGFLRTKESWLQVLSMVMIYTDMFLDELPVFEEPQHDESLLSFNFNPWELKSVTTSSLFGEPENHLSPRLASGYRLAKEEYGKGGKESFGMKAQLWIPIDPLSTDANIIVFRGTCLTPTIKAMEKNLGTGMAMNMDRSGFGRTAFQEFWPVFNRWIDEIRDSERKLIITGHSLGEFPLLEILRRTKRHW
jgi:hypothetical protein